MGFIEHLDNDPIRIGTVKGRAAVTMDFEGVNDLHAFRLELLLKLFDPVDSRYDEAQMIELLFRSTLGKVLRHFMERDIIPS